MSRNNMQIYAPIPQESQILAFTTSARSCDPLPAHATAVRLIASQDCYIEFDGTVDVTGAAGVGTGVTKSLSMFVKANAIEYYPVNIAGGTGQTISVIRSSADGNLYITPLTN